MQVNVGHYNMITNPTLHYYLYLFRSEYFVITLRWSVCLDWRRDWVNISWATMILLKTTFVISQNFGGIMILSISLSI